MISNKKKQTLMSLFWPIFFEQFLVTLVGVIDTAMVSSVGDNAVGAVGASGAYLNIANNAMAVVSVGAAAMMSRCVGAGQNTSTVKTRRISILLNLVVGGVFTLTFAFFTEPILRMVGTAPEMFEDAADYMRVVGISCVLVAVNCVFTAYLRALGRPKLSFVSATIGNAVNVILNAVFISMGYGTLGVALATLVSRIVTLALSVFFALRLPIEKSEHETVPATITIVRSVLLIGLPAAGESFLWTFCNSINMTFLNGMGADAVNTYSYVMQIANMLTCIVHGFGQSTGILVGWNIGSGDLDSAYRVPNRAFRNGVISGLAVNAILIPTIPFVLSLMTDDPAILATSTPIMAIHLFRLFGQFGNNVFGAGIKTAGDAKFILIMGLFVMPFWTFFGSWFLGTILGWGIYGYWVGASLDEFSRCFIMWARWHSRKWEKHCYCEK